MNNIEKIGVSLAIVGSFLPWEEAGDFVSSWTYGIQIFPMIRDNGGVLIILLTLIFILLTLRPPYFINNPTSWKLIVSALLTVSSLTFVARWLNHRLEAPYVIGAASIRFGLVIVVVGSVLLLWQAGFDFRKMRIENKSAG